MASTYTGLGVQLMTTGEKAGTWGTLTNTNWNIMEQISGGYIEQSIAGGAQTTTLTVNDGTAGATLAHRVIKFTGSITGNQIVTIPLDVQTFYFIDNGTTDGSGTPTVQFKYASGSGSSVTWGASDKGNKIIYAAADDGTNPNIVDLGMGDVTLTGTQTLTNKTLTSPKIGTSILDTSGNELALLTATGSAVNEFTIANAAAGAGPTFSSTGGDSNIDINVTPKGTGDVVLSADTVTVGDAAAAATIRSSGAGTLTVTTGGASDLILSTNNGTTSGTVTITDAANGDITLTPNGTGIVKATDAADATAAVKIAGKETMWVPATAMYAATTNGAEAAQEELTAGNPELKTFDFDTSTAESVQFNVSFPKSWDEGTVTYQTYWSASATDTGTGGFKLSCVSIANNFDYDTAFGTAVANTALAASGTQDDLMVNVVSGAVTIASAAVDTNTIFKLERNVSVDTNTGDLRLVGAKIFYTTDAANDA